MQVILGRIHAVVGTTDLDDIIIRRGMKGIVTDIISYCFLFICAGMFGIE
jgi:hypothetical protein